uniref:Uncharacterized protein n=1 Tax=Arundo donax TaxID=35708 RepID=A0A0A9EA93_ARUDO
MVFTIYGTSTYGSPTSTWSRSPWELNLRFAVSPTLLDCEGCISFIRSPMKVHECSLKSLFDNLSNECGLTSISHRKGLQIIETCCCCFCRVLRHLLSGLGPCNFAWGPGPSPCAPHQ